jgi:hypothetical protein
MKKILIAILLFIISLILTGCNNVEEQYDSDGNPLLYLSITPSQRVSAIVENGNMVLVGNNQRERLISAPPMWHGEKRFPSYFNDATLCIAHTGSIIELHFPDNRQPHSLNVRRWNAEYQFSSGISYSSEHIEVIDGVIHVDNDGHDYVYLIIAWWTEHTQDFTGYTFRTISGDKAIAQADPNYSIAMTQFGQIARNRVMLVDVTVLSIAHVPAANPLWTDRYEYTLMVNEIVSTPPLEMRNLRPDKGKELDARSRETNYLELGGRYLIFLSGGDFVSFGERGIAKINDDGTITAILQDSVFAEFNGYTVEQIVAEAERAKAWGNTPSP